MGKGRKCVVEKRKGKVGMFSSAIIVRPPMLRFTAE